MQRNVNPDYRINPGRAVYLGEAITGDLMARLTPTIVALHHQSRAPICVFIDSPGGDVYAASNLRELLAAPSQDGQPACRIITVVTTLAASAAADILSFGDYAIAYPGAIVWFHGVRQTNQQPMTAEAALRVNRALRQDNDRYASELASRSNHRFFFRYVVLKNKFSEVRSRPGSENLDDINCFRRLLSEKLGPVGRQVVERAASRGERYDALRKLIGSRKVQRAFKAKRLSVLNVEVRFLQEVIERHAKGKKPQHSLTPEDLEQITEDFVLFKQFLDHHTEDRLQQLAENWALAFIPVEDMDAYLASSPEGRATLAREIRPHVLPIWLLFASICSTLQEGEWILPAEDAYWLGLIDEVVGSGLPNYRVLAEAAPQQ